MQNDNLCTMIYLNNINEANILKNMLKKQYPNFKILIAENFDQFYGLINSEKIDFFIIEYLLQNISSESLIEKLRKSKKYNRSIIGFYGDSELNLNKEQFGLYGINLIIDSKITSENLQLLINQAMNKYQSNIIPENFNVLVLDDSPEIVEIISGHLEEMGHKNYKTSSSIKDALKLISENDFDLMLLDWNLADGSCIDLIESIRIQSSSQRTQNALIMVITGRNDVDDIMTLLRYNVVDHIIKPFDYAEFEEKLTYALERKAKTRVK